jgi:hypothetical protein
MNLIHGLTRFISSMDTFEWIMACMIVGASIIIFIGLQSLPDTSKTRKLRYASTVLAILFIISVIWSHVLRTH